MVDRTFLELKIREYEHPARLALSRRYPLLKSPAIAIRRLARRLKTAADPRIVRSGVAAADLPMVIARHKSVLRRKLGVSDPLLQEKKIVNLRQAIGEMSGITIRPGHVFSMWTLIGNPARKHGYTEGMLLSDGKITLGVGGGLCQLSNLLHWLFLHAPVDVVERHHHSKDVFPDERRTLPFASGATVFFNYLDLQVLNTSQQLVQVKLWLTETHLCGELRSDRQAETKVHVFEKSHCFVKNGNNFYRYNEIWREFKKGSEVVKIEPVMTNFAPVLYPVTADYIAKHGFTVLDLGEETVA